MYSSARFNDLDLALWEGISATNDKDACAFRIVITSSEIPISLRINYMCMKTCAKTVQLRKIQLLRLKPACPRGRVLISATQKSSSASVPRTSPVLSDEVQVVNTDTNVDGATMVSLVPLTAQ